MAKLGSEKYNIILIILIFVIPIIALNSSYYFISNIDFQWEKRELKEKALHEVETLAAESNFANEFAIHFRNFLNEIQILAEIDKIEDSYLIKRLKQSEKKIFDDPFPKYNLYVFKITKKTDLLFYNGNIKSGKRLLCKAFEYLYNVNKGDEDKLNESFAKTLLGKHTDTKAIAKEKRGITTNSKGLHSNSWFIWDYINIENKGVFGAILVCDEIDNHGKYGRLLALKNLKKRGKALGAFVPVYKDYDESEIQPPLDKSVTFKNWADSLTIKSSSNLEKWLKESLPQGKKLGNYSAFCYLERGNSHIAIVVVKALKEKSFPKWLIIINFLMFFILIIILYYGLIFGIWPQINIKVRFVISYALASVVPLSLLSVLSYGYILEYINTSIENAKNELRMSLKSFDSYKQTIIKEYKVAFKKAIKDPKLAELIKEKGIEDKNVTRYVVDLIENGSSGKYLPILGVRLYDKDCKGAISTGTAPVYIDIKKQFDSFNSVLVDMLIDEINKENPDLKLPRYDGYGGNAMANNAYKMLSDRDLKEDIGRHISTPIYKKNDDFCSYFIFDIIKIDGKTKYMIFVFWDDKTLDDQIILDAFARYTLKNRNQNFLAFKIKGQVIDKIGRKDRKERYVSDDFLKKAEELARQSSNFKKADSHVEKDDIIVVMPALNFSQVVFVGWVNRIDITLQVFYRIISVVVIILICLLMLWICSLRSSSIFIYPITVLKKALDEVSFGNLNIRFKDNPDNELGDLSKEFDKMIEELREKERLSKLISEQAVQALEKSSSGILNDTETFKGVALVSDIRNFTGMSEQYDPVIITELLNEHFAEMTKIISENGGLIYKYIGDAIEAVFPEKAELENTAIERAFTASFMMITKLKIINSRRRKNDLFTYRIGVGLCYGTMHSGTVGSVETRLDYSILGDPLKNAAKLEALSIQNPDFPIVISEDIAEKMATSGFGFRKIDSKNQDFTAYTLDSLENVSNYGLSSFSHNKKTKKEKKAKQKEKIETFSLLNNLSTIYYRKNYIFYSFLTFLISLLITFGFNIIFYEKNDTLKIESEQMARRLSEQLKCDAVLKSAFETICFDYYEDINKTLKSGNIEKTFKEKITQIIEKYEKKGYPIPNFYCCLFDGNKVSKYVSSGFSDKACKLISELSVGVKTNNRDKITAEAHKLHGNTEPEFNFTSIYYRRSSLTKLLDEPMYINTDKIYDKDPNNIIAYVYCGMPTNLKETDLPKYYTLLAEKNIIMALKSENGWYFSQEFPENEKAKFRNSLNEEYLKNKGFYYEPIDIGEEKYTLFAISKDLYFHYYSLSNRSILLFILLIIVWGLLFWILESNKYFLSNSIASRLRKDIFLSAILPIITVFFVSYLYVKEDFNIKKSEMIFNINNLMNEVESREYYYCPYYEKKLKNLPNENEFKDLLKNYINSDEKEKDQCFTKLKEYFKVKYLGYKGQSNLCKSNTFILVKEIIILGKDGWVVAVSDSDSDKKHDDSLSFGNLLSKAIKYVYFENDNNNDEDKKATKEGTKDEMIAELLIEAITANYGCDLSIKFRNFPNNLIMVSNSFTSIGFYIGAYPNLDKPDYMYVALMMQENEFKSRICNIKNDIVPYKQHLASGSVDNSLYCFYSPHILVGNLFFYKDNDDQRTNNNREELRTLKELGLASSWINTSYLPVSKKVDINGIHYLEAKQGNIIKDNVYVGLGSEYSILQKFYDDLKNYGYTIIYSIIMIFFIAQSIIYDLLNPVKKLIDGVSAASKGNYKFRTDFTRKDELGTLCFSFDKMMKGLEEKQLMNRMVSRTALDVTSNLSDIQSKKVDVALLYVTVPGFDIIMKQTQTFELFSKLRRQIAAISEIVINNGGDIDKIMGEKLLIAFHSDIKTPEEIAVEASNVALLIETCPKLEFKVSVGVNYGTVISGYLGVGEKQDFTIIGDPVNVAARIAVFAEKLDSNKCLVSESIYNKIREVAEAKLYGEVALKGKSEPMKVYRLL